MPENKLPLGYYVYIVGTYEQIGCVQPHYVGLGQHGPLCSDWRARDISISCRGIIQSCKYIDKRTPFCFFSAHALPYLTERIIVIHRENWWGYQKIQFIRVLPSATKFCSQQCPVGHNTKILCPLSLYQGHTHTLKRQCRGVDKIIVTVCTESCQNEGLPETEHRNEKVSISTKFVKWLPAQPVIGISSKWQHFLFRLGRLFHTYRGSNR